MLFLNVKILRPVGGGGGGDFAIARPPLLKIPRSAPGFNFSVEELCKLESRNSIQEY